MKNILLFYFMVAFTSVFAQPNDSWQDRKARPIQVTSKGDVKVRIRCSSSLDKDRAPLLILDGVVVDYTSLKTLAPQDIENIMVLKDTAAGALYGSRAAQGVILVTTKKAVEKRFYVRSKEDGAPVAGATIKIVSEKTPADTIQLIANDKGEVVTRKLDTKKLYTAIASSVGYKPQTTSLIFTSTADQPALYMEQKENVCEQVTVVAYPYRRIICRCGCYTTITRAWKTEPEKGMNIASAGVYPNPSVSGGLIHLKIDPSFNGVIQVLSVSGQLIESATISGIKDATLSYKLPSLSAGTYFVRLIDKLSSKSKIEKLVVQ